MTATVRKKLIEVSIPLEAINVASVKEKQIKTGKPIQLHHYWARRPLNTCRAVIFSQLVDDPSSWPDRFETEEIQDTERRRLHKIIERLVPWEASSDEGVLNEARWEIARSVAWGLGEEPPSNGDSEAVFAYLQAKAPPVYDPFSGGCSIPLEAQRLGLRAYGSDLNPVAVLLGKALVEIPPKFSGRPPVNPKAQSELKRGGQWNGRGMSGLADDVRYYGQWMRDQAEQRIGHLYPKAPMPDGTKANVIAWIWARTVRSPDPAAMGAMVPLVSSFMLSTREGKKAWVNAIIDPKARDGWRFEVGRGALGKEEEKQKKIGTVSRSSGGTCILTGAVMPFSYLREEASSGRFGQRLMAIVAEGTRGRVYLSPSEEHEAVSQIDRPDGPDAPICHWPGRTNVVEYGMTTFSSLFTARQLLALVTFSDLIAEARQLAIADANLAGLAADDAPLHEGGSGAIAPADAVATYLALAMDRVADWNNTISRWESKVEVPQQLFARQAIPMSWDYAEANPIGKSTGSLLATIENMTRAFAALSRIPPGFGAVEMSDAAKNNFLEGKVCISTDPPYYDNIGYADLSDFFYIWLKRSLAAIWPSLFRRLATPKDEELVATPYRHGGKDQAESFFMRGMAEALTAMRKASTEEEPLTVYYAFKQSEVGEDGVTSAGWASFLQAVVDAGLAVDGTWPMRTELANRMIGRSSNALASSIVLVCRKRQPGATVITRSDLVRALKRELPEAIDNIRRAGVGPVDMQQSVIGPGMGVFSRYASVLEDDDSVMPVKTALSLINRVWGEIENELDANFDPETQVAIVWYSDYGFDSRSSGELITLANAKNTPTNALFSSGVFSDLRGKAALTERSALPTDWTPANDKHLTVWECVQHTARVLNAPDGGAEAAARLVGQMGEKADAARALAYRLFEVATQKGWSNEALVYNELAQEWTHLEDLVVESTNQRPTGSQASFEFA